MARVPGTHRERTGQTPARPTVYRPRAPPGLHARPPRSRPPETRAQRAAWPRKAPPPVPASPQPRRRRLRRLPPRRLAALPRPRSPRPPCPSPPRRATRRPASRPAPPSPHNLISHAPHGCYPADPPAICAPTHPVHATPSRPAHLPGPWVVAHVGHPRPALGPTRRVADRVPLAVAPPPERGSGSTRPAPRSDPSDTTHHMHI